MMNISKEKLLIIVGKADISQELQNKKRIVNYDYKGGNRDKIWTLGQ